VIARPLVGVTYVDAGVVCGMDRWMGRDEAGDEKGLLWAGNREAEKKRTRRITGMDVGEVVPDVRAG
jgi:hypothetical protein